MSKILIIEDEIAIADLEKDYLELSGFDVEIENAGDTGLARALKDKFDLIVLDLMLPGIDGFEVCRRKNFRRIFKLCKDFGDNFDYSPYVRCTEKKSADNIKSEPYIFLVIHFQQPP